MRLVLSAVLLLATLTCAVAADAIFPRGSAIGLVPPPGMVESQNFAGFEDRTHSATLVIVDMPAEAYDQIEAGFTASALASKGITLDTNESFPLKGAKAKLFAGSQNTGSLVVRKWVLLVGTDTLTGLLTLQMPAPDAYAYPAEAVRAAFASVVFRSLQDQVAALPFELKDLAGFRPLRAMGGTTLILTDGPKEAVDGTEQPLFVISVGPGTLREEERRNISIRALSSLPGLRDMKVERAEPLRISGQGGFEVMANAVDAKSGKPVKVVQWMRFGSSAYVRMVGVMPLASFDDLYPRLRAIRDGVEGH